MKSIYIPNESFQSQNEVKIINRILCDNIETLYNYIDESIEIWILGDKDQEFLEKITETALSENRIFDPFDELPVSQHRRLLHVAVINHNKTDLKEITRETIYGNVDYNIYDFIRTLIFRLVSKFPKNLDNTREGLDEINKFCNEKFRYGDKNNNFDPIQTGSKN